jgi:hypothetical protein
MTALPGASYEFPAHANVSYVFKPVGNSVEFTCLPGCCPVKGIPDINRRSRTKYPTEVYRGQIGIELQLHNCTPYSATTTQASPFHPVFAGSLNEAKLVT